MLESAPFAAAPGTITITICAAPPATTIIRTTGTTISVFGFSAPNHNSWYSCERLELVTSCGLRVAGRALEDLAGWILSACH